ncbi:MAG: helix-turn-helix domain-containing protein [Clostridia bacterium]|nr:helix-turn-helix transcriptional regulator [Oscillospiraceae bacterium]
MTSTVFGYDHIMMRAEYRTPDPHSHLAVHFIAGLDGPVHCVVSGDSFDADAVFIASDVVHTAYAEKGDMLVFLFDTAGSIAEEAQKQYLCGRPYFCGDKETVEKLREIWKNNPPAQADSLITQLLGLDTVGNTLRDERISQVLEYLRSLDEVPEDITAQLCAKVCLSPSRLSHLFKENVGISLHRYLAMDKMRKGYIHFQKYGNITEASMRAGFDSPSHFAATCKRMFGISFSEFVKGSE